MKKDDFARRLADQSKITAADAADQLDSVVHEILKRIRKGESAVLPGLGVFRPGVMPVFRFDDAAGRSGPQGAKRPASPRRK